jgi:hypothetical protein
VPPSLDSLPAAAEVLAYAAADRVHGLLSLGQAGTATHPAASTIQIGSINHACRRARKVVCIDAKTTQ